jgi:Bacterial Ig domain
VTVNYPPSGPGFHATSAEELRTVVTDGYPGYLTNNAGFSVSSQTGAYVRGITMDGRVIGTLSGTIQAVVGGTVTISHSISGGAAAETGIDDYSEKTAGSLDTNLYLRPITTGVALRSQSGHNYQAATPNSPLPTDQVVPVVTLVGKVPKSTKKKSILIKGTASDAGGIRSVQYRIGGGPLLTATGTTSWQIKPKLKKGGNTITLFATDTVGNVSLNQVIKIKRK